jgi:uncharacterized membrane protein required for colicin V production
VKIFPAILYPECTYLRLNKNENTDMIIDVILLIVVMTSFWFGYSRGIIQTVVRYVSIFVGLMASFRFTPAMTGFLKDITGSTGPLMFLAGFLLTLFLTMILLRMLGRGVEGILESININFINQILGGFVSMAVGVLIYSVLLMFVLSSATRDAEIAAMDSQTYPYLKAYPTRAWSVIKKLGPTITNFKDFTLDVLDDVENMTQKSETQDFFNIDDRAEDPNPYEERDLSEEPKEDESRQLY